jgi:predicted nucleic acid-binding protein
VGLILLDSTVIVGFLDADDALHDVTVARFKEIVGSEPLAASVIGYAEVKTGAVLGHHSIERVDGFFDAFVSELFPVDRSVASRAAILRGARKSLPMPDALILATADIQTDVESVICGDGVWPKVRGLSCRVERLQPANAQGATPPRRA